MRQNTFLKYMKYQYNKNKVTWDEMKCVINAAIVYLHHCHMCEVCNQLFCHLNTDILYLYLLLVNIFTFLLKASHVKHFPPVYTK